MDVVAICAEHEAAHVVMYLELGYPVYSTEVRENGTGLTRSRVEDFLIDPLDHAAICMAGPVVEDRHHPVPLEERRRISLQRRAELESARSGSDRHNFEELPIDEDDPEQSQWWRENGRDFTVGLLENALGDIDAVNPDYIEVGYLWAARVLAWRAHDHTLITEALLAKRSLTTSDIYALPLRDLPREPWK